MSNRDVDGYPNINTADDGLVLTVYPAEGSGKKVTFDAVRAEIEKLGVKGVKFEDVKHVVDRANGHPVVLIPPKPKSGDSQIFVEVSEDFMSAKVTVLPPERGGKPATLDRIRATLATNGVVFGIKDAALHAMEGPISAMTNPDDIYEPVEAVVAEGRPVEHGTDAYLEKYWEKKEEEKPAAASPNQVENKNARVDYRNLNTIENVAKDSVLCKLVPATPGRAGMTVAGKTLEPTPGQVMVLKAGVGVKVDPAEPSQFIATETGQVVLKADTISVLALYEVAGDLTLRESHRQKVGNRLQQDFHQIQLSSL
jgi:uncharacterized protein (DUF342 family)